MYWNKVNKSTKKHMAYYALLRYAIFVILVAIEVGISMKFRIPDTLSGPFHIISGVLLMIASTFIAKVILYQHVFVVELLHCINAEIVKVTNCTNVKNVIEH